MMARAPMPSRRNCARVGSRGLGTVIAQWCRVAMDLEAELLRAARALLARDRVSTFTVVGLLELVRERGPPDADFPRLGHALVAHLVGQLAAILVHAGFLERSSGDAFALTAKAVAELEREPAHLRNESWHAAVDAMAFRRRGDNA
jgi:hypothetical protein